MIYDPSRRAQELRHRILAILTEEGIEEYVRLVSAKNPLASEQERGK